MSSGDKKIPGQVVAPSHTPSLYLVDTPLGQLKNGHHLILIPHRSSDFDQDDGTRGTGSKDQSQHGSQEAHAPLDESCTVTSNEN